MADKSWRNRIVGHGTEDPEQLLANPRNWRIHPQAQQDAMSGVLDEVGWITEVIVNIRTGFVVDGHLRVALAITRGEKEVPVTYIDVSEEEEKLILATLDPITSMIATDKELLDGLLKEIQTDNEQVQMLLFEIAKQEEISMVTKPAPKSKIDQVEELQKKWKVKRGQIWKIGRHRLLCGDATNIKEVEKLIRDDGIDLCLTDPPYSVGYEDQKRRRDSPTRKQKGDPYRDPPDAYALLSGFFKNMPCDVLVMTYPVNKNFQELAQAARENNLVLLYECVWVKQHFAYIQGRRYQPQHEPILFFRRKGKTGYWNVPNNVSTVFNYPREMANPIHPTARPIGLWRELVEYQSKVNGKIYDPFIGSGTTMVAAEQLSRICYGIDIEPKYCSVTLERMSEMDLKPKLTK